MTTESTMGVIKSRFPLAESSEYRGQTRLVLPREGLRESLQFLRDNAGFDMLVDVTCVDYLNFRRATHRFGLVYLLCNTVTAERLTVRVLLNEDELTVDSAVPLWEGANWMEREVWDMFGIRFDGHPDLRRILLPEEFTAHPLRKDYPLQGRGERHNFTAIRRGQA
ncbi:MAG: NADH-quinone oxidoreductase subunit C [Planctomycetales bacterium]|nr:NADH-quinone oxidoreductase subunit C [Planctomycetales bacterium]